MLSNFLVKLFNFHSFYTNTKVPNSEYLRQTMINVINNDAARIIQINNNDQNAVDQVNLARD